MQPADRRLLRVFLTRLVGLLTFLGEATTHSCSPQPLVLPALRLTDSQSVSPQLALASISGDGGATEGSMLGSGVVSTPRMLGVVEPACRSTVTLDIIPCIELQHVLKPKQSMQKAHESHPNHGTYSHMPADTAVH